MPPLSPAANPIGCFRDQGDDTGTRGRDLNGFFMHSPNMTTAACINECRQRGFAYARHAVQQSVLLRRQLWATRALQQLQDALQRQPRRDLRRLLGKQRL